MKKDIKEDLLILANIPIEIFNRLTNTEIKIICDDMQESQWEDPNSILEIDIGLGKLLIGVEEDQVKYKFIPSKKLEKSIKSVLTEDTNSLVEEIDKKLASRLVDVYKELY